MQQILFDSNLLEKQIKEMFDPVIPLVGKIALVSNKNFDELFNKAKSFLKSPHAYEIFRNDAFRFLTSFLEYNYEQYRKKTDDSKETDSSFVKEQNNKFSQSLETGWKSLNFIQDELDYDQSKRNEYYKTLRNLILFFYDSYEDNKVFYHIFLEKENTFKISSKVNDKALCALESFSILNTGKQFYLPYVFVNLIDIYKNKISLLENYFDYNKELTEQKTPIENDKFKELYDSFSTSERFFDYLISESEHKIAIQNFLQDLNYYKKTCFWGNFAANILAEIFNYSKNNYYILYYLSKISRQLIHDFFSDDLIFWDDNFSNRNFSGILQFSKLNNDDRLNIQKKSLKDFLIDTVKTKGLLVFDCFYCKEYLWNRFNTFDIQYRFIKLFNDNNLKNVGNNNFYISIKNSIIKDESACFAIKNYFLSYIINVFFNLNSNTTIDMDYSDERKCSCAYQKSDKASIRIDVIKFLLQHFAFVEPVKLFVSYSSLNKINNSDLKKIVSEKNIIALGTSSDHDVLFMKFNELILIIWFEGNDVFISPMDVVLMQKILLHLCSLDNLQDSLCSSSYKPDFSAVYFVEYIDSKCLIEYLVELNVVTMFRVNTIFDTDFDGKNSDNSISTQFIKNFSNWICGKFMYCYYAFCLNDYSNIQISKSQQYSNIVFVKAVNGYYKKISEKSDSTRAIYKLSHTLSGVISPLFKIERAIIKKTVDHDLEFSNFKFYISQFKQRKNKSTAPLNLKKKLEISFEGNNDITSFSVFLILSAPAFFNFHHCIELICLPVEFKPPKPVNKSDTNERIIIDNLTKYNNSKEITNDDTDKSLFDQGTVSSNMLDIDKNGKTIIIDNFENNMEVDSDDDIHKELEYIDFSDIFQTSVNVSQTEQFNNGNIHEPDITCNDRDGIECISDLGSNILNNSDIRLNPNEKNLVESSKRTNESPDFSLKSSDETSSEIEYRNTKGEKADHDIFKDPYFSTILCSAEDDVSDVQINNREKDDD